MPSPARTLALLASLLAVACGGTTAPPAGTPVPSDDAGVPTGPVGPAPGLQGTLALTVRSLGAPQSDAAVFTGVPFPPRVLADAAQVQLVLDGQPVSRSVEVTSRWPDGSARVVLVGFRTTLAAGAVRTYELRYGMGAGTELTPAPAWTRNAGVLALAPPRWYGDSGVFNLRFLASADNTLLPAFETRMRARYTATSDPPADTNPDSRNYYDHTHALYMALLRDGGPASAPGRIRDEVSLYRESEVLHAGAYRGQYHAGSITAHAQPIPFNVVRRAYVLGLLEDFYVTGDRRSFDVAKELADALLVDAAQQGVRYTWTERIPGWTLMGLTAMYEATLDARYLDAARAVAAIAMEHQEAMATKYPDQAGVRGQTGGFLQDRNGTWFDPEESAASGAGSPFMSTLLAEGLVRLYWLTGDARLRTSLTRLADWLVDGCYTAGARSFWYVCRAQDNTGTVASLDPMFLQLLGFGHQATGEAKYLDVARQVLAVNDWGNHIKEFNQAQHCSGQGLYLLQAPPGTVPLTLAQVPAPTP